MDFLGSLAPWQWALAGLVPAGIVALYFLRLKRKPLQVPSTYLWKKSIEDLHVNALWQRLRRNLLLLLQLLVCAAVLLALSRPTLEAMQTGRRLIVMIDNSASMSATDVSPSRLEAAKAKALEVIDQMQPGDAAMVIAFHDAARVVSSYTENQASLRQAIQSVAPSARKTDLREALAIASGLANPHRQGEEDPEAVPASLYLFSDGNFPAIRDVPLGNLKLTYVAIGRSPENVGIVTLAARASDTEPDRLSVFARIRNYGLTAVEANAELLLDGRLIDVQRLNLEPQGEQPMSFRLKTPESAVLSLRLDREDALALDNQAWTVVNPPRRARALIVTDGNPVLQAVLATEAVEKLATIEFAPAAFASRPLEGDAKAATYDLIVFDRCAPPTLPECNTFFIGTVPPTLASAERSAATGPVILTWKASHPLMRFLSLDDVNVLSAFLVSLPRGADPLIETDRGPVLFTLPRGVYTDLVQTFALVDEQKSWATDWPLKLSFPLFYINVVRTLGGAETDLMRNFQPGETVSLRGDEEVETAAVTLPSGRHIEIKRHSSQRFEILDTDELGVYRATIGSRTHHFAVNQGDNRESAIQPAPEVTIGAVATADASGAMPRRRELWRWLALAGFGVLVLEWYLYNRRVFI